MKVPTQRRPKHHRYLSRRTRRSFEIVTGGVRDRRYEEIVIAQSRLLEGMNVVSFLPRHPTDLDMFLPIRTKFVFVAIVLGLDYDSPSSREDIVVQIQLDRLEEEAAEHWNDSQVLSIGEMHDTGCRGHASLDLTLDQVMRCARLCRRFGLFCLVSSPFLEC